MRINVDDKWWSDPRRFVLEQKIGMAVDTVALRMWRTAQTYWYEKRAPIPKDIYASLPNSKEWSDVGLSIEVENGFYVRGSSEHFAWLLQRKKAGKLGGLANSKRLHELKYGSTAKAPLKRADSPPSPSPSPSPSLKSNTNTTCQLAVETAVDPLPLLNIWNENCGALPKPLRLNDRRRKQINSRTKEYPDIEDWKRLAIYLANSNHHTGHNDRKWKATFDFFIAPETMLKFKENRLKGQELKERVVNEYFPDLHKHFGRQQKWDS